MYDTRYYCHVLMKLEFSRHTQMYNFLKIRSVGAEIFHAGGQTDTQT
jgi:hypothetical protein